MNPWVVAVCCLLVGAVLVATLVLIVRDRPAEDPTFGLLALAELALLVQAGWGIAALVGTDREVDGITFVGYLVAVVLALPIGAFWSLAERTRAGTAVLAVAAFTVLALELRLVSIWGGAGA